MQVSRLLLVVSDGGLGGSGRPGYGQDHCCFLCYLCLGGVIIREAMFGLRRHHLTSPCVVEGNRVFGRGLGVSRV